jgi:hypothetical protein
MQRGYDRMVQGALDREARRRREVGRVDRSRREARHEARRWRARRGGADRATDARRPREPARPGSDEAVADPRQGRPRVHQAALELTSVQTPAEEAAAYHYAQAAKGVNPRQNTGSRSCTSASRSATSSTSTSPALPARRLHQPGAREARAADEQLAKVQSRGDTILAEHGVMTPEELELRRNAPARVRAGAEHETPTPAKLGIPSENLQRMRRTSAGCRG